VNATLVLGQQGRLVIPAEIRKAMGLSPGDQLHVRLGDVSRVRGLLEAAGITIEPGTEADAELAGAMRSLDGGKRLSLGDRCCLALAARSVPAEVLTADRGWADLDLPIHVRLLLDECFQGKLPGGRGASSLRRPGARPWRGVAPDGKGVGRIGVVVATGVGSMPGEDDAAYAEAIRTVLGELPGLPHLPEMPGRGAPAGMIGRTLALVTDLGIDLQPAGWRLTDASGLDHRRARSQLAQDLDQVEEQAQGYAGAFKVQVAGPWTLAAMVERPRGDKVLADHGARRELAQALAEGIRSHVADLRRRLPGADRLVVQFDEPSLAAVLAARVPTASGFGRHRAVAQPDASAVLSGMFEVVAAAGAEPWAHACAAGTPLGLLTGAGARGLSVDLARLTAADYDDLAAGLAAGGTVALGVVPAVDPPVWPETRELVDKTRRFLDSLGFEAGDLGDRLVITPACGLAGASPAGARRALGHAVEVTRRLA
jgi:AbrB family looped-hinge helix DNA binding protein